ncbi:MAG: polysaccharide biosynthesis protein [Micropruina sp.]|nr:polysaccharide biosynthesis protein [Micropruina sp.]
MHAVQLSIYGTALLDSADMALCDIRDRDALMRIFETHRPDVVFHAAALKHLPMLERYPDEGWKTNVLGTLNVLECAVEVGVTCFINISTDKAADATSVLGSTKRRAEQLTSWFAKGGDRRYLSVRFGNVLGSRGSVLHTFRAQIRRGGPVTVVDPEITRFFMTIPEACQLVIQAGSIGDPAAVLVLDMGKPVRIVDVARRMIRESGERIDIVYTGLRRGEKMHEVLFSEAEESIPTRHPLISRVQVPALNPDEIRNLAGMPRASRTLSLVNGHDLSRRGRPADVRLVAGGTSA